jgi:predicted ATPase/DNA-binding SARP family transcriptional activator
VQFRLLGPLDVVDDAGTSITIPGARLSALLTMLVLQPGIAIPTERLIDGLWGDEPPGGATNALQKLVSKLRRALPDVVERSSAGYRAVVDPDAVDVHRFEQLARRGGELLAASDAPGAAQMLRDALALWRGDALVDAAAAPFAAAEIVRLTELRDTVVEQRIEADLASGADAELIGELEALIVAAPLREKRRAQLIRALYRNGRQADALRAYQDARTTLLEELGIEPGIELRELEAAILAQDPALAAPARETPTARPQTNVRPPLTELVGRTHELDALATALTGSRLVTLVGPGGSGKTRVAVEVAPRLLSTVRNGVWIVELASVGEPAQLVAAIADALSIPDEPGQARAGLDRIGDYLASKQLVLMLDNCEHVVNEAARVADALLAAAPELRVLATSREALGLPGERVVPLPPLPTADAVVLFAQRANAFGDATVDDDATIADICQRLDGLPLAIELAAARTRALPVAEISKRLDQRFRLLTGGARTALPRQQTLRAVVDWSYDLLHDDERRVFERLSVFAGGGTLEAAERVCADDDVPVEDVADVVARLVDKSLVIASQSDGVAYFRLLQTLSHYGREQLASRPEATLVRRRHAEYFADFGERGHRAYYGEGQRQWLRDARRDIDDARAAIEWSIEHDEAELALQIAGAMGWFFWITGRADEGYRMLERACSTPGDISTLTRCRALIWLIWLGRLAGRGLDYPRLIEEAVGLAHESDDAWMRTFGTMISAEILGGTGAKRRSLELFDIANDLSDSLEAASPQWHASAIYIRGRTAYVNEDHGGAEVLYKEAVEQFLAINDDFGAILTLTQLAELLERRGAYDDAADVMQRGYDIAVTMAVPGTVSSMAARLANLTMLRGDFQRAATLHDDALERARDLAFDSIVALTLNGIAMRHRFEGDSDAAVAPAREALGIYERAAVPGGVAQSQAILGFVAIDQDQRAEADAAFRASLDAAQRVDFAPAIALAVEGLAAVAMLDGDAERAAFLLGYATACRIDAGSAPAGLGAVDADRVADAARTALGNQRYDQAFQAGAVADRAALTS